MDDKRIQTLLLTLLTPALWLIALNPWIAPKPVEAQSGAPIVDARIIHVDPRVMGDLQRAGGVPVYPGR